MSTKPNDRLADSLKRLTAVQVESAQERFERRYITSSEIAKRMGVNRTSVMHARRRGLLPDPIVVNESLVTVWERSTVEPFLKAWETVLTVRRREHA